MATKKREYEKPLMKVFRLKQQSQLLAGSVSGIRSPYGTPENWDWE